MAVYRVGDRDERNWIRREDVQSHSVPTEAAESHTPQGLLEGPARGNDSAFAAGQNAVQIPLGTGAGGNC